MIEFLKKHKIKFIIFAILLLLYILFPMAIRAVMPFEICEYDPTEVIAIEVIHEADAVMIEDPEQIRQLIEELNERRYFIWSSGWSVASEGIYVLRIYEGERLKDIDTWHVYPGSIRDIKHGIAMETDMQFITSLIPNS